MRFLALDHVQVAMPRGQTTTARQFYCGVLGLEEVGTPAAVAAAGGLWLQSGSVRLHLGVDPDFTPARKAHPALVVDDLPALMCAILAAGYKPRLVAPVRRPTRCHLLDPFGNRLEFIQA